MGKSGILHNMGSSLPEEAMMKGAGSRSMVCLLVLCAVIGVLHPAWTQSCTCQSLSWLNVDVVHRIWRAQHSDGEVASSRVLSGCPSVRGLVHQILAMAPGLVISLVASKYTRKEALCLLLLLHHLHKNR